MNLLDKMSTALTGMCCEFEILAGKRLLLHKQTNKIL